MNVIVAASSGFCKGVQHAVDTAMRVPAENTYILGELIHNRTVTDAVAARGIRTVESVFEVPSGARLILRSHGVGAAVYEACAARGIEVIDCTCPYVRRTQKSQLVRTGGLVQPENVSKVAYAHFRNRQSAYYLCTRGVTARRKELRQRVQGCVARHVIAYELNGFVVKQCFHTRIIIPTRAKILCNFVEVLRIL